MNLRLPDVTATVCNYNGAAYLVDCVQALKEQTHRPVRIVVYDNSSTDDSIAQVRQRFVNIEIVEMGSNLGPCTPRNRGLEEAGTEWVLQVDSDAILAPDCLEKLCRAAVDPGSPVACVMPRALVAGQTDLVHYDGGTFHYVGVMTLRNFFARAAAEDRRVVEVDAAISMALLLHRPKVLDLGGYDPDYFILFEDHDLSYRMRMRGERIVVVTDARVEHREGTTGISYREGRNYPRRRAYLHSRNRWMLLLRNHSTRALLLGLPGIVAYDLVWMLFAIRQGLFRTWLDGKRDAVKMVPRLWRERAAIQKERRVPDRELLHSSTLTHAPMVRSGKFRGFAETLLNFVLKSWWALVRWML